MPLGAFLRTSRGGTSTTGTLLQPDAGIQRLLGAVREIAPDVWLTGGAIRDLARGQTPADLDIAVPANAAATARAIAAGLGGTAFPLDEARGVARIVPAGDSPVACIDVTSFSNGIEADLARRDFTVDAMAAPLQPDGGLGAVLDPHGGLRDLARHIIRMAGPDVFAEDPVRLLRGVRLAVELDSEIEPETFAAMRAAAPLLQRAAQERQRDELLRMFDTSHGAVATRLLDALGLLDAVLPELDPARETAQPPSHHYWDVFNHSVETLAALDQMLAPRSYQRAKRNRQYASLAGPRRPWLWREVNEQLAWFDLQGYLDERAAGASRRALIKLAGLLHDVAKPETRTVDARGTHFYGHPEQGAVKSEAVCRRLRLSNRDTAFVALLVEEHLRPTQLGERRALPSHRAVYRFFRDLGDAAPACLLLALADGAGATGPRLLPERWRGLVAYTSHVLSEGLAQVEEQQAAPKLIDGRDLMQELGLPPGPEVGRLLAAIEEGRAAGEISSREGALALARSLTGLATRSPGAAPSSEKRAS